MTIKIDAQRFTRRVLWSREALTKKYGMLLLRNESLRHTKILYKLCSFYVELSYDKKMELITAKVIVTRLAKRRIRYRLKRKRNRHDVVRQEIASRPFCLYDHLRGMN